MFERDEAAIGQGGYEYNLNTQKIESSKISRIGKSIKRNMIFEKIRSNEIR